MRETSLSAKAALSCLLVVVGGYANATMRYRARKVDIITITVCLAHARECRAAYYKGFSNGSDWSSSRGRQRNVRSSVLQAWRHGSVAQTACGGCDHFGMPRSMCFSNEQKVCKSHRPATCSPAVPEREATGICSLEGPPLLVPHSFIQDLSPTNAQRPQMTPSPHLSSKLPLKSRAHHTLRTPLSPLPQPSEAHFP
jgi:hypothetical protein